MNGHQQILREKHLKIVSCNIYISFAQELKRFFGLERSYLIDQRREGNNKKLIPVVCGYNFGKDCLLAIFLLALMCVFLNITYH